MLGVAASMQREREAAGDPLDASQRIEHQTSPGQ